MNYEKRLFDFLYEQINTCPLDKAFGRRVNGAWRYYSTKEIVSLTNRMSQGLLNLGLKPGDKVATVVYRTIPEWVILDFAMLQIGVQNIPMYPTISSREYEYILQESESKYCFVGDGDLYEKVSGAKSKTPALLEILSLENHPEIRPWTYLLAPESEAYPEVEKIKNNIKPDDLATIIYTSGTTGNPKGVMLSHRNIAFNVEVMRKIAPISPGDRILSFLPVSHVYERAAIYAFTAYGGSVSFSTPDSLGGDEGDMQSIKPHFFTSVPRLLEKVYDRIYAKGSELKGFKRWMFFRSIKLAEAWFPEQKRGFFQNLEWMLIDALVFKKWRKALGGYLRGITTAASACPPKILRIFNAAGIQVREGYGLTEAAPALTFNGFKPGHPSMMGTVGAILDGVTIRIEEDGTYRPGEGEILAKSPGVMMGYYKQPEKTADMIKIIDGERWLATGDVGMLITGPDQVKFLRITDRKKELLKTSGGKYVAPTPIESALKEHRLVEQAMIVGENLKFVSALIVPSEDGLRNWCQKHAIAWSGIKDAITIPEVINRYKMLIDRINPNFSHPEQIKKFTLLPDSWEPTKTDGSEAELTPTLKLKRRVIMEKFEKEIVTMYQ
ncbi:MAG: long-chain fatty acid--CoA ligase [Lewinellaceae bacterium]|nr:long-chain fatty acid--CoA ligase [Saprospiraceae bacterium]MCB9343062.1 long-chain fatty acid--CoA ligase [Lewinellaceae bacterium]